MNKKTIIILFIACTCTVLLSFSGSNNYFQVTTQDVVFKIPPGFPKPHYRFKDNKLTPEIFVLGRKLFYDPVLSKDSTTSCGSCHQRMGAFGHMDHALSHGINGLNGKRNVPPLQNLAWQSAYMWDGSVKRLEQQPVNPITNPVEMGESMEHIIEKLKRNKNYVIEFSNAFNGADITSGAILKALEQFTGLMISANSRYDKYINGTEPFSPAEKRGLELFRGKCVSCHREPLFTDNNYRDNGLIPDTALNDLGRGGITGREFDNYKFKVPSLRNIEMTYPYMHDGRLRKLKDVLNYYGSPDNFSGHPAKEMYKIGKLSDQDKKDIIAFLLTLTDKTFLYDKRFMDPFVQ
jgi:cytochrome c peroxidase